MVTPQTQSDIEAPGSAQDFAPAASAPAPTPAVPRDAYAVLQIRSTASRTLVEQTYWRLAEQAQRRTGPNIAAHLAALNAAYSTLIDSSRREAYDAAFGFTPANAYGSVHANGNGNGAAKKGGIGRLFARTIAAVAPHEPTPYEALHVADDASQDVIDLAFVVQRLALKDAKLDRTEAMDDLERAYARIATSELRAAFDAGLPPPASAERAPAEQAPAATAAPAERASAPEVTPATSAPVDAVTIEPESRDETPERPQARITFLRPRRKPEPVVVDEIAAEPEPAAASEPEPDTAPTVTPATVTPVASQLAVPVPVPHTDVPATTILPDVVREPEPDTAPTVTPVAAQLAVPVSVPHTDDPAASTLPDVLREPEPDTAPTIGPVAAQLAVPVSVPHTGAPAASTLPDVVREPEPDTAPTVTPVAAQLAVPVPMPHTDAPAATTLPDVVREPEPDTAPTISPVAAQLAVPVPVPHTDAPAATTLPDVVREPEPDTAVAPAMAAAVVESEPLVETSAPEPPIALAATAAANTSRGGLLGRFRGRKQTAEERAKVSAAEDDRLLSLREVLASVPTASQAAATPPGAEFESSALPASAYLAFTGGLRNGTRLPLYGETVTLGTSLSAGIILPDDTGRVARDHARIWRQGDSYFFRQLDGFGSLIGGRDLDMPVVVLEDGDEITIGAHTLRFTLG